MASATDLVVAGERSAKSEAEPRSLPGVFRGLMSKDVRPFFFPHIVYWRREPESIGVMLVYLTLTREFNDGALRAILSSGQAVVMHRLAVMSKDGDWILRESEDALAHVLNVLERHGARYRYGAPLDIRWMRGGWSSHFEFRAEAIRVRTDFVTRPPRLDPDDLDALWREQVSSAIPIVDPRRLIELKKTNREKDYAVIGELARLLDDPRQQFLASRSARDLVALAGAQPELARELAATRPVLAHIDAGLAVLEAALDAERRALIHANERRLRRYLAAAAEWASRWPAAEAGTAGLPLGLAHAALIAQAERLLPFEPPEEPGDSAA